MVLLDILHLAMFLFCYLYTLLLIPGELGTNTSKPQVGGGDGDWRPRGPGSSWTRGLMDPGPHEPGASWTRGFVNPGPRGPGSS